MLMHYAIESYSKPNVFIYLLKKIPKEVAW